MFDPLPEAPEDGGIAVLAALILRTPACRALFETLLAGLALPYVRTKDWRGLADENDKYPAVNGPALGQPYSDDADARQEELGAAKAAN